MEADLWKTCRILANPTRLSFIRRLNKTPNLCVNSMAQAENISEVVASQHLKLLREHGFLQAFPASKWVHYRIAETKTDSHAGRLIVPLCKILSARRPDLGALIHIFTAFTHPRRVDITKILQSQQASFEQLVTLCDISSQALYRHLNKLIDRGVITETNRVYRLNSQTSDLDKALHSCCFREPFSHT